MKAYKNLLATLFGLLAAVPLFGQPTITTQPSDQSVSLGATVRFRVAAVTAGGAATCRWWFKDAALDPALNPSAATSTFVLTNTTAAMAGPYWAVLSHDNGSATSETAQLEVDPTFIKVTSGVLVTDRDPDVDPCCAWGDFDNDGYPDVAITGGYFTGGQNSHLYRNTGGGGFAKIASGPIATSLDRAWFGVWADADNDGDLDLWVGVHESALPAFYINQGAGDFTLRRPSAAWIANGLAVRSAGAVWGDYDQDGYLDLAAACWAPGGGNATANSLLHNTRDGRYAVVTTSGFAMTGTAIEAISWVDYDGDGDPDLFAPQSGDSGRHCLLFENQAGALSQVLSHPLVEEDGHGGIWTGADWGDYDNDGDLDVYVTCTRASRLFRNLGAGEFELQAGLLEIGAYHGAWGDYDNDGALDLFVVQPSGSPQTRSWRGDGQGNFEGLLTSSPANDPTSDAFQATWVDVNLDGFLDLFMATENAPRLLYLNNGKDLPAPNHWLELNLKGVVSNRSGVGANVRLKTRIRGKQVWQMRPITASFKTQTLTAHFGLGDAIQAEIVRIEWPSGIVQELANVPANQILTVTEPSRLQALGTGRVRIHCRKGQKFEAEVSNDLVTWTSLGVFANETGTLEFTDPAAGQQAWRFYRAVSR